MIVLLATLFFLTVFHLIYEAIVAPALRLSARHRLFALRDQLRKLSMTNGNALDDRHFRSLQGSLNLLIRSLELLNLSLLVRLRNLSHRDASFRARVEERATVLDDCSVPEALDIRKKSVRIALEAFVINCGGGLIYFAPLLLMLSGYSRLKQLARVVASMSDSDVCRIEGDRPLTRIVDV